MNGSTRKGFSGVFTSRRYYVIVEKPLYPFVIQISGTNYVLIREGGIGLAYVCMLYIFRVSSLRLTKLTIVETPSV